MWHILSLLEQNRTSHILVQLSCEFNSILTKLNLIYDGIMRQVRLKPHSVCFYFAYIDFKWIAQNHWYMKWHMAY